jgi:outer membrane protein assembly factor BamB
VVVGIGGKSLLAAFDLRSGDIVWETPNQNNWKMSHSSVINFMFGGEKVYFYCALGGITGVSQSGEVLFESNVFNHTVVAPTPVYLGKGKVFLTAGYGSGSMIIQIEIANEKYTVSVLQVIKPNEGIASEQQTPIYYKGLLYSIQPKDAGSLRNQFVCYDPEDISKMLWSSGKSRRYGLGPYIFADNKFFILSDEGELTMMNANSDKFEDLGKINLLNGHDAWGPMAIVKGRLLARDSKTMVCIDLRSRS